MMELWMEGFLTTGDEGKPHPARLVHSAEVTTYEELVADWKTTLSADSQADLRKYDEQWSYWNCRLFTSENEAKEAFELVWPTIPPAWTMTSPTKPGHYWAVIEDELFLVEIDAGMRAFTPGSASEWGLDEFRAWWSIPIEPPGMP